MIMSERKLISSGSPFEAIAGYSRAVVDGEWVFVSGTTGFDYKAMTVSDDVVEQTEQTFRNIVAALEQAGVTLADVVRTRIYVASIADFNRAVAVIGRWFKEVRPANTALVTGFVDARIKFELEVTARRRA